MPATDIRDCVTFIYGLCEPGSSEVRYVGKTDDPNGRLSEHMHCPTSSAMAEWLASLGGKKPRVLILKVIEPGQDIAAIEREHIEAYGGPKLLNGGEAGSDDSHGFRLRLREAREKSGLSQRELSRRAGLVGCHVGQIECGRSGIVAFTTGLRLASILGVSPQWLAFGTE